MRGKPAITLRQVDDASTLYRFFYPGVQKVGSGNVQDASGKNRNGIRDAGLTDDATGIWVNDGYFTPRGNSQGVTVPGIGAAAAVPWDMANGDSLYYAFIFKAANPGFDFGFTGNRTLSPGFGYNTDATGHGYFKISDSNGAHDYASGDLGVVCDSKQHLCEVFINGRDKLARAWVDGAEKALTGGGNCAAVTGSTNPTFGGGWGFGHTGTVATSGSMLSQFRVAHALIIPVGFLPSDAVDYANRLHAWVKTNPSRPIHKAVAGL